MSRVLYQLSYTAEDARSLPRQRNCTECAAGDPPAVANTE